mgnify:CR=1 FL=1
MEKELFKTIQRHRVSGLEFLFHIVTEQNHYYIKCYHVHIIAMGAYICHHLSDNYVDLSDHYVDLSEKYHYT